MSLDIITKNYIDNYKLKGITPEWLTLLTKTVNSRNISTVDWNIAMDDIRKVASDSVTTYNFITAFNKEFNEYYKRNIKSIHYTTESEDKLSNTVLSELTFTSGNKVKNDKVKFGVDTLETYKHGTGEEVLYCSGLEDSSQDVGFVMTFSEPTYVETLQLYVRSVAASVNVQVCPSADGITYIEDNKHTIYLQSFGNSVDVYLVPVGMYVKSIKIVQPANNGYTNGRFSICGIEMYKSNLTGEWILTRYDGSQLTIPMVDPADFAKQIQRYLDSAKDVEKNVSVNLTYMQYLKEETEDFMELTKNATLVDIENQFNSKTTELTQLKDSYVSDVESIKEDVNSLQQSAKTSEENALTYLNALVEAADDPNGFLRLDSTGMIPTEKIPAEKTIEMFRIYSVNDLTTLSKAQTGDIAYIINENGDADANYRLVGSNYAVRSNWVLQTTSYVSQSAVADRAVNADNATKVNGVLVRFGTLDAFNASDKGGLYIITDYSESES